MLVFLFVLMILLSTVMVFLDHYSKVRYLNILYLILLFLFLWIILGWSSGAYDVDIGISRYNNYALYQSYTEIGYNTLVTLGHKLGMSYRLFFVLCSFFEIFIMIWFVNKNCKSPSMVFLLFLIYPFVVYLQYIRNILAFSIVLIAIDRLINRNSHYILKYTIYILLASTIHSSSLFFLLFLLANFFKKMQMAAFSLGSIFILLLSTKAWFYDIVANILSETKADILTRSVLNADGVFGRSVYIFMAIIPFFVIYYLCKKVFKINVSDSISNFYFNINLLAFMIIPLTINFGVGFARIATFILFIDYVYMVNKISCISSIKWRLFCFMLLIFMLLILWVMNFKSLDYRQLVLYPFFVNNELINGFNF